MLSQMIHLLGAIGAFSIFVATHALCYRSRFLKPNPTVLLFIAGFWFVLYVIFFTHFPSDFPFWKSSLLLYLLLCVAYIMEYTMVELESPSMRIIQSIQNRTKRTASKEELRNLFSDDEMILARLEDLVDHGFAQYDGLRYTLTPRGKLISRCFALYRNFIRRGLGG